jgi:DNA-directed RNA polymerase beta subunit
MSASKNSKPNNKDILQKKSKIAKKVKKAKNAKSVNSTPLINKEQIPEIEQNAIDEMKSHEEVDRFSEMSNRKNKVNLDVGDFSVIQDDLYLVGDSEVSEKGLADHHLSSANDLYKNGIPQIITTVFKVEKDIANQRDSTAEDKLIETINVVIRFTDVYISRPTTVNYYSGKEEVLYPNVALLEDKTYSANLRVNASIVATAHFKDGSTKKRTDDIKNFKLCRVPVMVKSVLCNTHGLSKEALMEIHEDPTDPGGYFIIKGVEWVIDCIENILFNQIRVFKNEGYSKEIMRVEFVSKPGDTYQNSDYFLVRLLSDNQLTCEIVRNQLKGIQIPFYLLFRLLGWSNDKDMMDNILYGYESSISKNMLNYIIDSINAKYNTIGNGRYVYNQNEVMKLIVDELKYTEFKYLDLDKNPENYHIAYSKLFNILDTNFLPHVGLFAEDRPNKMRYLALIIRKLFLVKMGNMEPTDRDSYKSKRIHAAGTSYAKTFKTYFNASIIQQIKRRLVKDFRSMSFSLVDLASSVKSSVYGADFERSIMQTITSGNKSQITVNKKSRTNRLSSQLLDRKNQIAGFSTLRQVTTTSADSSKQSERANEMRRVHMSFLGYICIIHSSDGEKVGINKQLAIFANILGATSSDVIKSILLQDKLVIPLNQTTSDMIYNENLHNIFVNGEWIGCTANNLGLVNKYRQMRRNFEINPLTTIYWDNTQDESFFWVDVGRPVRPLMIVYNNKRDPEKFNTKYKKISSGKSNFIQGIGVSQKILDGIKSGEIDMDYLIYNNLVEYITPEEQENCYLCPFYDQLKQDKNNELNEYTHCDIPQAILGVTALTSPFANHNQTPRITFQTSQCKQTCGVFALNWPYRCDKDTFLQYNCETPLVKTVANKLIFPNGSNAIIAIQCYSGYNVEDSIIISQGAIDRGLYDGSKFTFEKTELEQREEFGNPDATVTQNIKSGSYAKLRDGIISVGSTVEKGDVLIGKYIKNPKTADHDMTMIDRSIVYKSKEKAIVHNVIVDRNEEDERFAKVALRKIRPVAIGDKFSCLPTAEVLTTRGWIQIQHLDINEDKVATLSPNGYLDYVKPTGLSSYNYDGDMYRLETPELKMFVTKNHKLYASMVLSKGTIDEYHCTPQLLRTHEVINKNIAFQKNAINVYDAKNNIILHSKLGHSETYIMNGFLQLLGVFFTCGTLNHEKQEIHLDVTNNHMKSLQNEFILSLNLHVSFKDNKTIIHGEYNPALYEEFVKGGDSQFTSQLPQYVYNLSQNQSRLLIESMLYGINCKNDAAYGGLFTKSITLANDLTRIALHAGWSADIIHHIKRGNKHEHDILYVQINKLHNSPQNSPPYLTDDPDEKADYTNYIEKYEHYSGMVYCLEVPDTHIHVYYMRESVLSPPCWTGNSSRAGQKGVCGVLLRDSDMPFTKDGLRPEMIINPHAIPSRMTIGQLYESHAGNWCASKGTHTDGTIFKSVDIESMGEELESMGLQKYGYHRLYSGITGEYIDAMIFMGPTYYQRLQKFVIDTVYSISQGPTDSMTRQPLAGKNSDGGIRIGEMERDVIAAHGSSKFLKEKFFDHSDGFTEYICRCGKSAVVNVAKNIYKCKYCKDNADIAAVPTSWSSKLFMQEMESMNVGIRRHLKPFTYESIREDIAKEMIADVNINS